MATLKQHIDWVICNYPSLYRCVNDPRMSRLLVLEHMFFVIGNGYEWDRDKGQLILGEHEPIELPDDYFKKELFTFDVPEEKAKAFEEFLGNRYFYVVDHYECDPVTIHFEATEEDALKWQPNWDIDRFGFSDRKFIHLKRANAYLFEQKDDSRDLGPYRLSEYSAIVELIKGKTNSPHIENYSFDDYPVNQEWINGCIEVAREAVVFYDNPKRAATDFYHPNETLPCERYNYNKAKKEGEIKEFRENREYKENETVEEYCERIWQNHLAQQQKYLQAFLVKYDTPPKS